MTKAKPATIAGDRLRSFVERIERLREEKKAIGADERDVFAEAKGVGYDTKAMREVLKRRAMDDSEAWDDLIDTYEHALGARGAAVRAVEAGATYEEAAERTELSRATVARAVAGRKNLENDTPSSGGEGPGGEEAEASTPGSALPLERVESQANQVPPQPGGCSADSSFEAGNQAHEGEDDGHILRRDARVECDSGRSIPSGPADRHGNSIEHGGRQSASPARSASLDRSAPGQLHVGAISSAGQQVDGTGSGASAGNTGLAAPHSGDHGRRTEPAGGDLLAPAGASVGVGRGVDAPSTPPLGAVGSPEGDRVARPNDDLEIPQFLRRTEARRAGT